MKSDSKTQRRRHLQGQWRDRDGKLSLRHILRLGFTSRKLIFRFALFTLAFIAILPPLYFHFKLRRFNQMQLKRCSWLNNPPLVCAHGGDSSTAFPNTMAAYQIALDSQVDCIEIDVSRSSDGVLFALHDRDLQRISGNSSSRVGFLSKKEVFEEYSSDNFFEQSTNSSVIFASTINELEITHQSSLDYHYKKIPSIEDALKLVSGSVRKVILDAKVGPPSYEKGMAKDILSTIERSRCKNCIVWAKSDSLARDVMKLSADITVGYIVMMDPSTGARTNLLRMRDAGVVGVYHPLIDDKLVKILHGRKKKVYAWTVDNKAAMQKMLYEHVDAIVTSNPTLLQGLMQDIRTTCLEEGFSLSL